MVLPVAATLLMAVALGWFGLHVLQRGVIFVDLALAQVAALGATYAVFLGHEPDEPISYALGLLFTALGAVAFALARHFEEWVAPEALIGIAYVVFAAAGAVLMDFAADPHGAEKLQHLMVGNVVWVRPVEIGIIAGVAAAVGAAHFAAREGLLQVSFDPEAAAAEGRRVWLWDLCFYLTFGLVITTLVHVAGVLLIFSYLIIPAVVGRLFASSVLGRLGIAWAVAVPVSIVGIAGSYSHAAGPIIVMLLGGVLIVCLALVAVRRSAAPLRTVGGMVGAGAALTATLIAARSCDSEHDHPESEHVEIHVHDDLSPDADPATREQWYRGHEGQLPALKAALRREDDPSLRLLLAVALARGGASEGLDALAELAAGPVPFLRMEAHDRLVQVAGGGAVQGDPLAGPVTGWSTWEPPEGWRERAKELSLP